MLAKPSDVCILVADVYIYIIISLFLGLLTYTTYIKFARMSKVLRLVHWIIRSNPTPLGRRGRCGQMYQTNDKNRERQFRACSWIAWFVTDGRRWHEFAFSWKITKATYWITGWWFQICFIFTPKIGEDEPILTILFFRWVETTSQIRINVTHLYTVLI